MGETLARLGTFRGARGEEGEIYLNSARAERQGLLSLASEQGVMRQGGPCRLLCEGSVLRRRRGLRWARLGRVTGGDVTHL